MGVPVMETEMGTVVATEATESMPGWILTISYALHMLATVLWIGGLLFQALFLLPLLSQEPLKTKTSLNLTLLQTRFQPLAWLSLAVLFGTGLTQMAAHPQYEGLLAIRNQWSIALFAKHLSILPMLAITAFQSFVLHPRLERDMLKASRPSFQSNSSTTLRTEKRLIAVNTLFSIVILVLTALARTS
jgi:putative copper export protein